MNDAEAKQLAETSGNRLLSRVLQTFHQGAWSTFVAPYYYDIATDKAREADLIAERFVRITHPNIVGAQPLTSIRVRLFIECKRIAEGVVFWLAQKDLYRARSWISNTGFRLAHANANQHHYLRANTVAKVFASQRTNPQRDDNEAFFRAINQCLSGYLNNRGRESMLPKGVGEQVIAFDYPVIVCSDFSKFYRTELMNPADPVESRRHGSNWS